MSNLICIDKNYVKLTGSLEKGYLLQKLNYFHTCSPIFDSKGRKVVILTLKNRKSIADDINSDIGIDYLIDAMEILGFIEKDYEQDANDEYRKKSYKIILK